MMKGRRKIETRRSTKAPPAKKSAPGMSSANGGKNLIRGRFKVPRLPEVEAFSASLPFDRRLYRHDILGSIAHAQMLAKVGLITAAEAREIAAGLRGIEREISGGHFRFDVADEDIHLAIERRLIEKIGAAGGKLHTARSRNDQVALDLRLYLRDEIGAVIDARARTARRVDQGRARQPRDRDARLYPSAARATDIARPSRAGLCRDARARSRAARAGARAHRRDAARGGRVGRHDLADRSAHGRARARLSPHRRE